MCGICVVIDDSRPVTAGAVRASCDRIVQRGPDAEGITVCDGVGLGIRRLSIIDLEEGQQPIFNEDGSVAIVFNGEIYRFQELRRDLIPRGHRFTTASDTEAILHLFEEEGERATSWHVRFRDPRPEVGSSVRSPRPAGDQTALPP